ncbi:MAG: hypothetical protein U7127_27550 [Phormidium sp.]
MRFYIREWLYLLFYFGNCCFVRSPLAQRFAQSPLALRSIIANM